MPYEVFKAADAYLTLGVANDALWRQCCAALDRPDLAGDPRFETEAKRVVTGVMRSVGERLGNTPAVARSSYVSPAVVEQYLDGRTIDDFRPRHLRVVGARDLGLELEERALLSLLRSWRIRQSRAAA